jgi:hypothetical protein
MGLRVAPHHHPKRTRPRNCLGRTACTSRDVNQKPPHFFTRPESSRPDNILSGLVFLTEAPNRNTAHSATLMTPGTPSAHRLIASAGAVGCLVSLAITTVALYAFPQHIAPHMTANAIARHQRTGSNASRALMTKFLDQQHRNLGNDVRDACKHLFHAFDPACPRLLVNKYSAREGFGHQFAEFLFGMRKAHEHGLSYIFEPFSSSGAHKDNYTDINAVLGLTKLFAANSGVSREDVNEIIMKQNGSFVGINEPQLDKGCGKLASVSSYRYCLSDPQKSCFSAPENAHLYQNAANCFRKGARRYGTAFQRCLFLADDTASSRLAVGSGPPPNILPPDMIVVVWHVRVGDRVLHRPGDKFYRKVLKQLQNITAGYRLRVLLVGKTVNSASVPFEYVDHVDGLAKELWNDAADTSMVPKVIAPTYDLTDAFVAMMQADVLIGSGSSLTHTAAVFSDQPLFFNHVAKHGYNYGAEMFADSVDLAADGTILDSIRRLRVVLKDKIDAQAWRNVCRSVPPRKR